MLKNILRFPIFTLALFLTFGNAKIFSQVITTIPEAVKQVYGDAAMSFSKTQMDWVINELERSKIQKRNLTTGENIPLLSSISLVTKYIPSLQKDDFNNPQSINPLKYSIDFLISDDQFFRIDGTDYVLFVAGKK